MKIMDLIGVMTKKYASKFFYYSRIIDNSQKKCYDYIMNYYGDYHTHTYWSDGKCTIEELISAAEAKGLKDIAITEHGLRNTCYSQKKLYAEYEYIQKIKSNYSINVLFGSEADFIDEQGHIDISGKDKGLLDVLSVGFHQFTSPASLKDWFRMYLPSMLNPFFCNSSIYRKRNTRILIKCITNNDIDFITHPNHRYFFDVKEVAKACVDNQTYMEINIKHLAVLDDILDELLSTDVKLIVNSDAHHTYDVGRFDEANALIAKYGIEDRIVNLGDKRPVFKKH